MHGDGIGGLTQGVTDCIRFFEESVPTKKVHCFPSKKHSINRDVKVLFNRKKRAFMAGDNEDAKKEIRREPRRAKDGGQKDALTRLTNAGQTSPHLL